MGCSGDVEGLVLYIIYRRVSLWCAFAGRRSVWEGTGCGGGAALANTGRGGAATLADAECGRMVLLNEILLGRKE